MNNDYIYSNKKIKICLQDYVEYYMEDLFVTLASEYLFDFPEGGVYMGHLNLSNGVHGDKLYIDKNGKVEKMVEDDFGTELLEIRRKFRRFGKYVVKTNKDSHILLFNRNIKVSHITLTRNELLDFAVCVREKLSSLIKAPAKLKNYQESYLWQLKVAPDTNTAITWFWQGLYSLDKKDRKN